MTAVEQIQRIQKDTDVHRSRHSHAVCRARPAEQILRLLAELIGVITFLSRLLGMARESIAANYFGGGMVYSAFQFAFHRAELVSGNSSVKGPSRQPSFPSTPRPSKTNTPPAASPLQRAGPGRR